MNSKNTKLNPKNISFILIATMFLLTILSVAIFTFFQFQLKNLALEVKKANDEASASKGNLSRLKEISEYLSKEKDTIERAKSIVADNQSYQYQDQIISDITVYAKKAGVYISGVDFQASNPSAPAPGSPTGQQATPPQNTGPNYVTAVVNIKNPVQFSDIMQFLYYLENNLTRMQITGVNITKKEGSSQDVSINPLSVRVYVK